MEIAALIKQARQDARVTQKELGRRVGRSRESISQLEAGVRTPSFASLEEILAALGKQMKVELEPLDADVRQQIVEHRHDPDLPGRVWFAVEGIEDLADLDLRVEGLAAAALLGAPVAAGEPQIAVAHTERPIPVQPLHEIDTTDRNAARVLRLLREQAKDARGELLVEPDRWSSPTAGRACRDRVSTSSTCDVVRPRRGGPPGS